MNVKSAKPRLESRTRRLSIAAPHALELSSLLFDPARTALSTDEIAEKLRCTKAHVLRLIETGELGAVNIGTGKYKFYRVPAAEWEKFLRKRAAG